MLDAARFDPQSFLASPADIVGVIAHFAGTNRRRTSQRWRDPEFAPVSLFDRFPGVPGMDQPAPPPAIPLAAPASPGRRSMQGKAAGAIKKYVPVKAKSGTPAIQRRLYCECGHCKWCLDNARWDRIFNEKFADPTYYGGLTVRQNSTLAEAR